MIKKSIEVSQRSYQAPAVTLVTLETESGMVLCTSSDFEDVPEVDPDTEF